MYSVSLHNLNFSLQQRPWWTASRYKLSEEQGLFSKAWEMLVTSWKELDVDIFKETYELFEYSFSAIQRDV